MSDRYVILSGASVHLVWDTQELVHFGSFESETEAHKVAHELNLTGLSSDEQEDALIEALTGNSVYSVQDAQKALSAYVKVLQGEAWEEGRSGAMEDAHWASGFDDRTNPYTGAMGGRG